MEHSQWQNTSDAQTPLPPPLMVDNQSMPGLGEQMGEWLPDVETHMASSSFPLDMRYPHPHNETFTSRQWQQGMQFPVQAPLHPDDISGPQGLHSQHFEIQPNAQSLPPGPTYDNGITHGRSGSFGSSYTSPIPPHSYPSPSMANMLGVGVLAGQHCGPGTSPSPSYPVNEIPYAFSNCISSKDPAPLPGQPTWILSGPSAEMSPHGGPPLSLFANTQNSAFSASGMSPNAGFSTYPSSLRTTDAGWPSPMHNPQHIDPLAGGDQPPGASELPPRCDMTLSATSTWMYKPMQTPSGGLDLFVDGNTSPFPGMALGAPQGSAIYGSAPALQPQHFIPNDTFTSMKPFSTQVITQTFNTPDTSLRRDPGTFAAVDTSVDAGTSARPGKRWRERTTKTERTTKKERTGKPERVAKAKPRSASRSALRVITHNTSGDKDMQIDGTSASQLDLESDGPQSTDGSPKERDRRFSSFGHVSSNGDHDATERSRSVPAASEDGSRSRRTSAMYYKVARKVSMATTTVRPPGLGNDLDGDNVAQSAKLTKRTRAKRRTTANRENQLVGQDLPLSDPNDTSALSLSDHSGKLSIDLAPATISRSMSKSSDRGASGWLSPVFTSFSNKQKTNTTPAFRDLVTHWKRPERHRTYSAPLSSIPVQRARCASSNGTRTISEHGRSVSALSKLATTVPGSTVDLPTIQFDLSLTPFNTGMPNDRLGDPTVDTEPLFDPNFGLQNARSLGPLETFGDQPGNFDVTALSPSKTANMPEGTQTISS